MEEMRAASSLKSQIPEEPENPQPLYTFQSTRNASGLIQEIYIAIYQIAKAKHREWIFNKNKINKYPLNKQIARRIDPDKTFDEMSGSPYLE